MTTKIANLLRQFGISPAHKGYTTLIDTIEMAIENPFLSMKNELYPTLGEKYETAPLNIERRIRHAIKSGWELTDMKLKNQFFSKRCNVYPSNTEFIFTLADSLKRGMC